MRVLIVEDETALAQVFWDYVEQLGHRGIVAPNAEVALEKLSREQPDVILLDVRLPDSDGFTVARTLRADRYTQHIPIIFLSGRSEPSDRVEALEIGADDFVAKPFDAQELRLRIERVLKARR